MSPQDRLYKGCWKKSASGWTLWLKDNPKISAWGGTFALAQDELLEAVFIQLGDTNARLIFAEPPAREDAAEFGCLGVGLVAVHGDDWAEVASRPEELFSEGVCATCGIAQGRRTEEPLVLSACNAKLDGGIAGSPGALIYFYSEQLLLQLGIDFSDPTTLRPVQSSARRKYYELLGPATFVQVAHRNITPQGWTCDKCSSQLFGYDMRWFRAFVAGEQVPTSKDVMSMGVNLSVKLCVSPRRWRGISSKKSIRGMVGTGVGVLPAEYVDSSPKLQLRSAARFVPLPKR